MGCRSLLQGNFPTQGSNPGLLHCRRILNHLSHQGSPFVCMNIPIALFPVIRIYILFQSLFHYRSLQDIQYSSLCYIVGLCWLSFFFFLILIFGYTESSLLPGLSLVAVSGGHSSLQCEDPSLQWLLLLQGTGSRRSGFSSCGFNPW